MGGRDSLSPTRRETPREQCSSTETPPSMATEPSKRFCEQPQEYMQSHPDAMQQSTLQPQRGTSNEDLLAPPKEKMENKGKVPYAVSMEDAQFLQLKGCCPSSDEMEKRVAVTMASAAFKTPSTSNQPRAADWTTCMPLSLLESCCSTPFRASGDQEQMLCDSCGKVFFDEEDAKSADSPKTVSSELMFSRTNSIGPQYSFETANQGTDAHEDMEKNDLVSFREDPMDDSYPEQIDMRSYLPFTQPPLDSYGRSEHRPDVNTAPLMTGFSSRRTKHRFRSPSRSPVHAFKSQVDTSAHSIKEHKVRHLTMAFNVPTRTRRLCESVLKHCRICTNLGVVGIPKFHKFMDLASELRERIYAIALDTGRPIKPHLCDYPADEAIQFHDDNQKDHFATSDLLGITRVNKETRAEALPIFYSANTFEVGPDTTTYFDRLAHLDRFDMIRHVRFSIETRNESASPSLLRRMNQYIKEADAFVKDLIEPLGRRLSSLKRHPQYTYGGIPELNTLIVLMKLTSPLASEGTGKGKVGTTSHSKLVVPVPSASAFTSFDRLKFFPAVMYGLGIQIHYVENVAFSSVPDGAVEITWHQRFQKKDFGEITDYVNSVDITDQTAAYKRALELDPGLEQKPRPRGWAYLRTTCVGGISGWFDIVTEGGGVGYGR